MRKIPSLVAAAAAAAASASTASASPLALQARVEVKAAEHRRQEEQRRRERRDMPADSRQRNGASQEADDPPERRTLDRRPTEPRRRLASMPQEEEEEEEPRRRLSGPGPWGKPPPGWGHPGGWGGAWREPSSSPSGSKKGGYSGKKGSSPSSSSCDGPWCGGGWGGPWGHGGGWGGWKPSSSSPSGSKKGGYGGKKGSSGSSSSSSSSPDGWHGGWGGGWAKPGWGYHGGWGRKPSSSSPSGSKKGSGKGKGGKSGKKGTSSSSSSSSSWDGRPWGGPGWGHGGGWGGGGGWDHHAPWEHDGWHGGWSGSEDHVHGHFHWIPKPWSSSSSPSGSKKGKSGKSSKGASPSSSSSSPDFFYHVHAHEHSSSTSVSSPDEHDPGICAPSFDEGGLECSEGDFEHCTEIGRRAECGAGRTCYDKTLCPAWSHGTPVGVCDAKGQGLECAEVATFCTEPGERAECGAGRNCFDAGLCGYGSGDYDGVCGLSSHEGGGLDCKKAVATKCTDPGERAECGYGATCFDEDLCWGGDGFCAGAWNGDGRGDVCDDVGTWCEEPGKGGQCAHGGDCISAEVCDPTKMPTPKPTPGPTPSPTPLRLAEVCFLKGEIVDCPGWGSDGWSDGWESDGHSGNGDGNGGGDGWDGDGHSGSGDGGDGHSGRYSDAMTIPFTYTVDTDGKVKPSETVKPLENAILEDVVDFVDGNEDFKHFSGKITAAPKDEIATDDWCGDGHAVRCTVVRGEMDFYVDESGWAGDGNGDGWDNDGWQSDGHLLMDKCDALHVIKEGMDGQDYSEDVDGVTAATYRNSDLQCGMIIAGAAAAVPAEEKFGPAAFAILFGLAALLALLALLASKLRRKPAEVAEEVKEDISLISNSLQGSLPGIDGDDPYANTIDVHKCTSIYCNCNKMGSETSFLPVPKKIDMAKTMSDVGIEMERSPTAVSDVQFFPNTSDDEGDSNDGDEEQTLERQDSIMRVPIRSQLEPSESGQPLAPVNEIPHDSEIESEMGSVVGEDTTVPPPPPLAFHPAYQEDNSGKKVYTQEESDGEASI